MQLLVFSSTWIIVSRMRFVMHVVKRYTINFGTTDGDKGKQSVVDFAVFKYNDEINLLSSLIITHYGKK